MTDFALRALNALFLGEPKRAAIGVLVGILLSGLMHIAAPYSVFAQSVLVSVSDWFWIAGGLILLHARAGFRMALGRTVDDDAVQKALDLIEDGVRHGTISKSEAKSMRLRLCLRMIERAGVAKGIAANENSPRQEALPSNLPRTPG